MPFVPKLSRALPCKRLAPGLAHAFAIVSLCALGTACSHDDPPADTSTLGSTTEQRAAPNDNSVGNNSFATAPPADPAPATLTIQTPATPASDVGTALSAADASRAPLASPVIHTVD
ncbi:hypothetical protein F3J20_09515 [Paraburkholderia sp. Cy-641]|uniref:hypothetical protein n=1 Tax=Paraburkholderia sp. Cy-641 TaxID=2608337 RepID=UPI001422B34C|nr:hypothetical protein [Paraburkholderia sp. Cy-641]NIF77634.1 hypothetical protein [Paraburkholderia sp. Cy-641]